MKKIIEGKIYNTETAEEIGEANARTPSNDFRYWSETLYRTPRSKFFLKGEGGPMTHWSKPGYGGGFENGEGIRPLEDEEAREWAEKYMEAGEYLKFFPAEDA